MANLSGFVKNVRDTMRNDKGINGDAQRLEQMSWMLFLKIYDEKEKDWEIEEDNYKSIIPDEYRWCNWATEERPGSGLTGDELLKFVDEELFPALKGLEVSTATPAKKAIVKTVFTDCNQYMKDGVLLRQLVNVIDTLDLSDATESHAFGEIYETILKELQSAGSAGEFYTPRAVTDFMAQVIAPQVGEKCADFACGTGGFLTSWLKALEPKVKTADDREKFAGSIYGIEKKQFPYTLCVTNMLLHGIEKLNVFNDNSLTKDLLSFTERDKFDVILMNPPYGGNEKASVKSHFPADLRSSETADLFMALIAYRLKANGRAAVIIPDGFLFGNDTAKRNLKEKLLREFNLHTIVRLPSSVFAPYTSITTNILFFNKEKAAGALDGFYTNNTWYYRVDMPAGIKHFSKTNPIKLEHLKPLQDWWANRREIIIGEGDEKSRCFSALELLNGGLNFDYCKYPQKEEVILSPEELLTSYLSERKLIEDEISRTLGSIAELLGIELFNELGNE